MERVISQLSDLPQTKIEISAELETLRKNQRAQLYIAAADRYLEALGYTEHGFRHCGIVSQTAYNILKKLGFEESVAGLAAAAGFVHDMGNMLGRSGHHYMGALLAKEVLEEAGYELHNIVKIMQAIVAHEEGEGIILDEIAAALLLADKSDVHRSRVRSSSIGSEDIHDRVNYAATESELIVRPEERLITLSLIIDTRISQVIEYFEIFLARMTACRRAARVLECNFNLLINNTRMA